MTEQTLDLELATTAYLNMKDARAKLKRDYDLEDNKIKALQAQIEAAMLGFLNANNLKRAPTSAGYFKKRMVLKPSAENWDTVYAYIAENKAWDLLEKRLGSKAIEKFMKDNVDPVTKEPKLPPGIKIAPEWVVTVSRQGADKDEDD